MSNDPPELLPGDHLLYYATDFFGWVTKVKTWSPAVHIEVYTGNGWSVASRNGKGVNRYAVRQADIVAVLRPNQPLDIVKALEWFYNGTVDSPKAIGQKYDWLGLLDFTLAVQQGSKNKMFCSEFATRFDRHGGLHSFNPNFDADRVAPAQFLQSPVFDWVWTKPDVSYFQT